MEIKGFEIISQLGQGAMGVVYKAKELSLNRIVAIKVLNPQIVKQLQENEVQISKEVVEALTRFSQEAVALAKLDHPSIVKIYKFAKSNNLYYLSLEFIDGNTLDKVLETRKLDLTETVELLIAISKALGFAHTHGVVHRDVKPSNIFVTKDHENKERYVLGDFGIAKHLNSTSPLLTGNLIVGTPAYISPEQINATNVSPASDIYSVGILAYELVTGQVPFQAPDMWALLGKHLFKEPEPIENFRITIPASFNSLIKKMLNKEPSKRPQNGNELAKELETIKNEITVSANTLVYNQPSSPNVSSFIEKDVTAAIFELIGFSSDLCQKLLPARIAFLLENWYRLSSQAVSTHEGIIDRLIADRVIAVFGHPKQLDNNTQQALDAAIFLKKLLSDFNRQYGLSLNMRVGIASGASMVGKVIGDITETSFQGSLFGKTISLLKVDLPCSIRLSPTTYKRISNTSNFVEYSSNARESIWGVS